MGARLTAVERNALPPSAFAFPNRQPPEHPIHTPEHAESSLAASAGTADAQTVKDLAYGRWPQLNPALRAARGTNAPFSKHT